MKAMVLAAGEGTRLRPLTLETPKVLLPVGAKPLIEYILAWLKKHGMREIAINLCYLGDKIKHFLGDGSQLGVKLYYSHEEIALGTAGGVKRMEHFFSNTFVVACGDILTDFDLTAMIKFHRQKAALATLALVEVSNPWEVGIVVKDETGRVVSFVEKPPRGTELSNMASAGIYVLEREVFNHIPSQSFCDFGGDIFPKLIQGNLPVYGYVLHPEDYWIDIGTLEKYQQANRDVEAGKFKVTQGTKG